LFSKDGKSAPESCLKIVYFSVKMIEFSQICQSSAIINSTWIYSALINSLKVMIFVDKQFLPIFFVQPTILTERKKLLES